MNPPRISPPTTFPVPITRPACTQQTRVRPACNLRSLALTAALATTLAAIVPLGLSQAAVDPFAEGVRPTEPLTPARQQETFHLPPGFTIQLVAAEPDIAKPMNMAFDARGRLWVSSSVEYPFPATPKRPGRDTIKILSDFDATGRARRIETFADGLDIPIGLYPYRDGVIAWGIPNIWFLRDTDNDGRADRRDVLFGPLGWERDTHGNQASFRRTYDGWLYGTHGFNNNSTFKAADGSSISLNSGNTWRIRPDGSRVEQHTWGQVNPFGLCTDALGHFYSADCHSSPIYQLLRGAYYPSFGKPHDGLGFAPVLMEHSHGSTAIAGIVLYADNRWPAEFSDNIFVGNVMTSRVNRDRIVRTGSSPTAIEMPDLVRTDDPWFRPVDLQLGPDGALYIADFYNRIIGHYEVPLLHPGRDRERGRIWRLVYQDAPATAPRPPELALAASMTGLIGELAAPNLTRRLLALNELVDRYGANPETAAACRRALRQAQSPDQQACLLWALQRLGKLELPSLRRASNTPEATVRTHSQRILAEIPAWTPQHERLALKGLQDTHPEVRRAAAEALATHPNSAYTRPLLTARLAADAADTHLVHALRIALRNQLRLPGAFAPFLTALETQPGSRSAPADLRALADVALGVAGEDAGSFLLAFLQRFPIEGDAFSASLRHAARHVPLERIADLARIVQDRFPNDPGEQLALFRAARDGATPRAPTLPTALKTWGTTLAGRLIASGLPGTNDWTTDAVPGLTLTQTPWFTQPRRSADGDATALFFCSLPPGGEHLTGRLVSPPFVAPRRLRFFLAGHDGVPDRPPEGRNLVRVRHVQTGEVLAQTTPPRNDVAQPVTLDLSRHEGQPVRLEVIDGHEGNAYAWLAIGRFEPPLVRVPERNPRQAADHLAAGAVLARELDLRTLQPQLSGLVTQANVDPVALAAIAETLAAFRGNEELAALAPLVGNPAVAATDRARITRALTHADADAELLPAVMQQAARTVQIPVAVRLSASPRGASRLLEMARQGQVSPRLLAEPAVKSRLLAALPSSAQDQAKSLLAAVPDANAELDRLIAQRRREFDASGGSATEGARLFQDNCAVCHQFKGAGALVGPQLDGVPGRGIDRLLEDILDPNRNVDRAFRSHTYRLTDGEVASGLPRREQDGAIIVADAGGRETAIPKSRIASSQESDISLMPSNFGELLTPTQLAHLLKFLLQP